MSMINEITKAIRKSLENGLTEKLVEEFELEEEAVKELIVSFLDDALKSKGGKGGGKARVTAKGKDGKSATTGYRLFSAIKRDEFKKKSKKTPTMQELGAMWKNVPQKKKAEWNDKAAKANAKNGLPPKGTKPSIVPTKAKKGESPKVVKKNGKWILEGTNFVVASKTNKQIIGRQRLHLKGLQCVIVRGVGEGESDTL